MDPQAKVTAAIVGITFSFACFLVLTFIISKMTGWDKLARDYPLKFSYSGKWLNWRSGQFGTTPYNVPINVNRGLSIGYTPAYLYLKTGSGLQFFMHDLQIPWDKVQSYTPVRFWWRDMVRLNLADGTFITLQKQDIEPALQYVHAEQC